MSRARAHARAQTPRASVPPFVAQVGISTVDIITVRRDFDRTYFQHIAVHVYYTGPPLRTLLHSAYNSFPLFKLNFFFLLLDS